MLASHLVRELSKAINLYGDAEVVTEGLNTYGTTGSVAKSGDTILIRRCAELSDNRNDTREPLPDSRGKEI